MWTALTILFLRILNSLCLDVDITTPISMISVLFSAIMYVDDCDLLVIGKHSSTPEEMQRLLYKWCCILCASGGVLRPEKCWWCGVVFDWNNGKWEYANSSKYEYDMTAKDCDENICNIRRSEANMAEKTLGIWYCADESWDYAFETMKMASTIWADEMNTAYLTKYEALLAVTSTITKTWDYPIGVVGFTEQQCNHYMSPAYLKIIPKIGPSTRLPLAY